MTLSGGESRMVVGVFDLGSGCLGHRQVVLATLIQADKCVE